MKRKERRNYAVHSLSTVLHIIFGWEEEEEEQEHFHWLTNFHRPPDNFHHPTDN